MILEKPIYIYSCNSTTPMIHEDRNPELETYASFEQELVESLVID